ncbi:hypothetical protein QWY75_08135 [Pontixanthobacter aestiaquae]|uniref:Uncharacterized protein n=1 Tax=Pontixanthobacter aestiaquae TaxID=1509367 RepID=A0A844Z4J2_9SPHN|nr:hypothetical protein [Pontixanthobacter aestiaquae]MDN3646173.1 hypothetical protein [Pontixanthobacter aestiaquae]MXO82835.1 hypothetical protein [Pontixanthobacter aestiaquae]
MKVIVSTIGAIALTIGTAPMAFAQSSSAQVSKDGSCPKGFSASGSSCKSSSKVAIVKIGSCPTGFRASANYCVGDKDDYAEVRSGSCPSGLKASGKYCVK